MFQHFSLSAAICNPRVVTVFIFIPGHRAQSHSIELGQISMVCMSVQSDGLFIHQTNLRLKETPLQAPADHKPR